MVIIIPGMNFPGRTKKKRPTILNSVDSCNWNALHISAFSGSLAGTKFLGKNRWQHEFDVFDKHNSFDMDAFQLAKKAGNWWQVRYLYKIQRKGGFEYDTGFFDGDGGDGGGD